MPTPTPWFRRRSTWILGPLLLLLGSTLIGLIGITHTTAGVHALARGAHHLLGLNIQLTEASGSLARGFFAKQIHLTTDDATVIITDLQLTAPELTIDPKASPWLTIHVPAVRIESIAWISRPDRAAPKPLQPPTTLALPIGLDLEHITLARLSIQTAQQTSARVIAQNTEASVALGEHINLRHAASQLAGNRLTLSGRMAGRPPFAIEAGGSLVSRLSLPSQDGSTTQDAPIQISWRATDHLTQLNVYAGVTGGPGYRARGTVHAALQPFSLAPLRRLVADLEGIDPAAWWPQAPHAELQISADLQASDIDTHPDSPLSLNGPLRITNAAPGPINRTALPLQSLSATLAITAQAIALRDLQAHIAQGSVRGQLHYPLPSTARAQQAPEATLTLHRINLAQLHDAAQPLRISGPLKLQQQPDQTQIQASLQTHSGALSRARLDINASVNSAALTIHRAQLALGQGWASVQGQLARSQTMAFELHGKVQALNLGILWRSPSKAEQAPLTDLNGGLQAQGSLSPHPQGSATLTVRASRLLGRPLQGQIALALNTDEQLTVNAQLRMHNAQLKAQGQLAGRADTLTPSLALSIQAPDLAALGLPLQGALEAQATASGAWRAPAIDIQATASAL
ncbi:MAG TPA: hypothetical protein PLQ67_06030, partial [Burkholderiaceae bacterium]|nr:hypothetical protein [Burkholderiaceae bacterium]